MKKKTLKSIKENKLKKIQFCQKMILSIWVLMVMSFGNLGAAEFVKQDEFVALKEKNSEEFKQISISLAEIKSDMGHIQQDLTELKDLRRSIFDRMLDIILAGGLAFTGAKIWRRKNDKRNSQSNNC